MGLLKRYLALLIQILILPTSYSATIEVNTDTSGFGCTLMDAIDSANANAPLGGCLLTTTGTFGDDTIVIPPEQAIQTLFAVNNSNTFGANGLPRITTDITIEGNDALISRTSISGTPDFRLFYVSTNASLTLKNVRLQNGKETTGSAVFVYGGTALLENVLATENTSTSSTSSGTITMQAVGAFDTELTLKDSTVGDNTGTGVRLTQSGVVSGNVQLRIQDSVISNNSKVGLIASLGSVRIDRTEVSFNQSSGIRVGNDVVLAVRDSTISNNISTLSSGGGIGIALGAGDPTVSLFNNTITGNTAGNGGGIWHAMGTLNLVNNIIAGNFTHSAGGDGKEIWRDPGVTSGSPIGGSQENNLLGHAGYSTTQALSGLLADSSDILATSDGAVPTPLNGIMAALKNNGGAGRTHRLVDGSPALDAAAFYQTGVFLGEGCAYSIFFPELQVIIRDDQRAVKRPQNGACDIGAFEKEETTFYVVPLETGGAVIFDL